MTKRNPKQEGSNIYDCIPQEGPCPLECDQCFYNRKGAFYAGLEPFFPDLVMVNSENAIVRVNSGHDSNCDRDMVMHTTQVYRNRFFNTSLPNLNFPGPVVFTANARETMYNTPKEIPANLMFVRLLVKANNLQRVWALMRNWTDRGVTVVLTFMRFFDEEKALKSIASAESNILPIGTPCYELKKHILNEYWCPTREFMLLAYSFLQVGYNRLVTTCGTLDSSLCKDCRNCEYYYWITKRRMQEAGALCIK